MKKLPIGIQSFAEIRHHDYVYVDKTKLIHRLMTSGKHYFLSRPRRFGKSLTLSTIQEIYQGNQALFSGLWIENHWDWSKKHPVIHLPFNALNYADLGLEFILTQELAQQAKKHELQLERSDAPGMFKELIEKLALSKGRVVILIDEYDKPIIDFLEEDQQPKAKANRETLRNFYSILKNADVQIEFFLMTGVSKFSQAGIFSQLNHLNDVTLDEKYASLLGYTGDELEHYFVEHLKHTWQRQQQYGTWASFLAEIRNWYNGYSWDAETRVYNPFSILNFLDKRRFGGYWFQSGTPTFLLHLIKNQRLFNFNDLQVSNIILDSYEIESLDVRTLFFQTGYLTIKAYDWQTNLYTLDYPNREVEEAMTQYIIATMLDKDKLDSSAPVVALQQAFLKNDLDKVVQIIHALLKDVPSLLIEKNDEHFYHALVHLHFRYLGIFMDSEVHTSDGRMDAVVKTATHIYILEFKVDQSAEVALVQIKNKDYAAKYKLEGKSIIGLGINFDRVSKGVSDWASEVLV